MRNLVLDEARLVEATKTEVDSILSWNSSQHRPVPYISVLVLGKNYVTVGYNEGVVEIGEQGGEGSVLAMAHYPDAEPGYGFGSPAHPRGIHDAVRWAVMRGWWNLGDYKTGIHERESVSLKHPPVGDSDREEFRINTTRPFYDVSDDEMSRFIGMVEGEMASSMGNERDARTSANFAATYGVSIFYDTLGVPKIQDVSRFLIQMSASAPADDLPTRRFDMVDNIGALGGYETVDLMGDVIVRRARELGEKTLIFARAAKEKESRNFRGGNRETVFEGRAAGGCIHELGAGHMAEAPKPDEEQRSDYFRRRFGDRVGPEILTVIDGVGEIAVNGHKIRPASYYRWDDEGTPKQRTRIIDAGEFKSFLTSRVSAGSASLRDITTALTGNARLEEVYMRNDEEETEDGKVWSYLPNPPEERMSTLFIPPVPNGRSVDEMLKDDGVELYVVGSGDGEVDLESGQGMLELPEIYLNNHGTLTPIRPPGRGLMVVDDVYTFMNKIIEVGGEETVDVDTTSCGSNSGWITHCCGGAAIRVKGATINLMSLGKKQRKGMTKLPPR